MRARIEFHDGLVVDLSGAERKTVYSGRVVCEITADNVVRIHNMGRPYHLTLNAVTYAGEPVYLKSVIAHDPVLLPELLNIGSARRMNGPESTDGIYILLDQADPKVPTPQLPLSNDYHLLDGSDCFAVRFRPHNEPFVNPKDVSIECLKLLNFDHKLLTEQPALRRILGFYKVTNDSFNPTAVDRNFGWWIWPESYNKRWGNFPPLSYMKSQYGFISIWANSDGLTNEHYDHPLYFLVNYLLNDDRVALEMGLMLLRKKICYGLYDMNDTLHPYYGYWKWEKGNRLGFFQAPSSAKEWDTSLVIANKISPEPIFERALEIRKASLIKRPNSVIWPRAAGGRMAGRYLQNLWIMYKDDVLGSRTQFLDRAESFIEYFFTALKPGELWIPNDYVKTYTDAWEGMTFFYYALKWITEGNICKHYEAKLYEMLDWYCQYGVGWRNKDKGIAQAQYHVNVPSGAPTNPAENAISHISFWYRLWPYIESKFGQKYKDIEVGCNKTMFGHIGMNFSAIDSGAIPPAPDKLQVDQGGLGPSAEKQWPMFLEMLIRL